MLAKQSLVKNSTLSSIFYDNSLFLTYSDNPNI